jgi:hypothetical protein
VAGTVKGAFAALACAAAAAVAVATGATAAPGTLVSAMTAQAADVPGATQVSAGSVKQTGYIGYQRTFVYVKPAGAAGVLFVRSAALVASTVEKATLDFTAVGLELRSASGRRLLAATLAKTVKVSVKDVVIGKLRTPKIGDHVFELPFSVRTVSGRRLYATILFMRLDRVVVFEVVDGLRPVGPTAERLARRSTAYIATALTPVSVSPPVVTGTAQQGQTLTATNGTWSVAATYTYQWQRCDGAGANCTDIADATANAYAVAPTDVGTTLRVVFTATDRFGAAEAQSAVTAAVT